MSKPVVELEVEVDEYGFKIDGNRFYEFEPGIRYVLNSKEDLWVFWNDDARAVVELNGTTDHIKPLNLTSPEHHKYVSNSLLYMQMFKSIANSYGTPVGLLSREIEETVPPPEVIDFFEFDEHWNDTIMSSRKFLTNGTEEDLFNLEQEDWLPSHEIDVSYDPYTSVVKFFDRSERYFSIAVDGKRLDPSQYQAQFISNSPHQLVQFRNPVSGHIYYRSDLCHNARNNGSTRVELIIREGDERSFYMNSFNGSFKFSLVGKGKPAPTERVYIRQQIDDYILNRYPELYAFLVTYFDGQNIGGEAQSYLRNMIEYTDVDVMPRELLEKKLRNVFTPFDTSRVDPRILAKRMVDFFQRKGTQPSYEWLSNALFEKKSELHRFSGDVIRFSYGDWHQYIGIMLSEEDLLEILEDPALPIIFTKGDTVEDVADALIGHTIIGRVTNSVAAVEGYEVFEFNRAKFYRLRCTLMTGEFDQSEPIDIRRISNILNINRSSSKAEAIGIVDFEIENRGIGYKIGQEVVVKSFTGQGLIASVGHVDLKGGIKSVRVDNQGWFFEQFKPNNVSIISDQVFSKSEFDFTKVEEKSHVVEVGNFGYVSILNSVYPIILREDHIEIAGHSINKNFYALSDTFCASAVNGRTWFFAKSSQENKVLVIDTEDNAFTLNFDPTEEIVFVKADSRTLFISTGDELHSFDVSEAVNSNEPKKKTFTFYSEHGTVRSLFIIDNALYGVTETHLLKFDNAGVEQDVFELGRVYDFTEYLRTGETETLFMSSEGNLYAYQWYTKNNEAKLKPIFGRINRIHDDGRRDNNVWSGHAKLHDNLIYQDFSLGIVLEESTNSYMKVFDEMVNTSGFRYWGVRKYDAGFLEAMDIFVESATSSEFPPLGYEFVQAATLQNTLENIKSLDDMDREANVSAIQEDDP